MSAASFRINTNPELINASFIKNVPITSNNPVDGDTLVYDSALNQYVNRGMMSLTGNNVISGNITFDDVVTIGSGSSQIGRLEFGQISTANLPAGESRNIQPITFGPFPANPTVVATVQSQSAGDPGFPLIITAITTTGANIELMNIPAVPTTGPLTIDWIAASGP